jgi:aldehyde dehydrogenase (NAD+)
VSRMFTAHCGQACGVLSRVLVQQDVYHEFLGRLCAATGELRIGDPADPDTEVGPLISSKQRERVEAYIHSGLESGGTIVAGGSRPASRTRGYFMEPTIFTGLNNRAVICREEIFGPVAVILPFSDEADAVRIANDSEFGLGGGVWSVDLKRAYRVACALRTGFVLINGGGDTLNPSAPFGGIKASGFGRERGEHGLSEFLTSKAVLWPIGR